MNNLIFLVAMVLLIVSNFGIFYLCQKEREKLITMLSYKEKLPVNEPKVINDLDSQTITEDDEIRIEQERLNKENE